MKCGWWSTLLQGYTPEMYQIMLGCDPIIHQTAAEAAPSSLVSWADCHALNQRLRQDGCTAKQGLYAWSFSPSHHSPMFGWTGGNYEMLLHNTASQPLISRDPPPDGLVTQVINWGNEEWRSDLVLAWVNWMRHPDPVNYPDASYDILIFDNDGASQYADQVLRLAGPGGTEEYGTATTGWSWWWEHLGKFKQELRWALESEGKMLITNGISVQNYDASDPIWQAYGPHYSNFSDYTSGVIAELLCRAWLSPTELFQNAGMLLNQLQKRRQIYMYFCPTLLIDSQPGYTGPTSGPAMEQFYWTFYKLFEDPSQTIPFYHDGAPYRGVTLDQTQPYAWDSGILSQLDLGHPIEGPLESPSGVLWRRFYGGYAMLNYAADWKQPSVSRACRVWDKVSGPIMGPGTFNMPGNTSWVLHYA